MQVTEGGVRLADIKAMWWDELLEYWEIVKPPPE